MSISRVEHEKKIVYKMIWVYCKGHKHDKVICSECGDLIEYAHKRLDTCKFGDDKTFCSKCSIHCYKPEMRERIKKVMRYSGPRILFYNPVIVIKHFLQK